MKIMKRVLAAVLAIGMMLSLAACGGKAYASVEDYINSPTMKTALDATIKQLEGSGMNMAVKGDGNKLVYEYTFDEQIDADTLAVAKESLESSMKSQEATMKEVAKSLSKEVKIDDATVVVRYLNADGSEIYSAEFKAD